MRGEVNRAKYAGIGLCATTASSIFEVGDDGQPHVAANDLDDADRGLAEDVIPSCPACALSMRS